MSQVYKNIHGVSLIAFASILLLGSISIFVSGLISVPSVNAESLAPTPLYGYAWSSNIGWIKFGGLSGFPSSTGCSRSCNAKVSNPEDRSSNVIGWARACAGTIKSGDSASNPVFPGDCSTMTSRSDGWDGWIELSGTNHAVTYAYDSRANASTITGYAWGGDVIGWLSFNLTSTAPAPVPLVASCSGAKSGSANPQNMATWTANPSGGIFPYTYSWKVDGSSVSGTTISITSGPYSSASHTASVTVTDSASPTRNVVSNQTCGSLDFGSPIVSSGLTLTVHPLERYPEVSNSDPTPKIAKVRKGKSFNLAGAMNVSAFDAGSAQITSDDSNPATSLDTSIVNGSQQITQNTPLVTYTLFARKSGTIIFTKIKVQAVDPSLEEI